MKTEVGKNINKAIDILDRGDLVAVPTETVYGLAANGLNTEAIDKIYRLKKRPENNPLILHFGKKVSILPYVKNFPPVLSNLADRFWPGPLTILLEKNEKVPEKTCAGLSRVAVRIPNNKLLIRLLNKINYPLAAPSANLYGKISPTRVSHVLKSFSEKIDYILDDGACKAGIESTIVGIEKNKVVIYRPGIISQNEIKDSIGYLPKLKTLEGEVVLASGMVKHHYAPETPCDFFNPKNHPYFDKKFGYLLFSKSGYNLRKQENIKFISKDGNCEEAASKLYDAMHELDEKGLTKIFIELLPQQGIGIAVNDKIRKAVAKFNK